MEQWLRHSQQFWTVTLRRHENFYFQTLEKLFGHRSETSNSVSLSGLLQSWSITETLHLLWPVCTRLCPPNINLQHLPKMHFVKFTQVTQKQIKQRCLFLLPCTVQINQLIFSEHWDVMPALNGAQTDDKQTRQCFSVKADTFVYSSFQTVHLKHFTVLVF